MSGPKIFVLGANGMLGHKMFQVLSGSFDDVTGTIRGRRDDSEFAEIALLQSARILEGVDALRDDSLFSMLRSKKPAIVVNCIGAIKQRSSAHDPMTSIKINSLLPHELAAVANEWGGRLIHFSTDCVFSGAKGDYSEDDSSDAEDLYGRSKYLGETAAVNSLVLRTSIIGRELSHHQSLLDWFLLGDHKTVRGFTQAWWSGVTTNHLARLVGEIITEHPYLSGLFHVSSGRISKYDLLCRVKAAYGLPIEVTPDDSFVCDRSLRGERLREAIGYKCASWDTMLTDLLEDPTPYEKWIH